MILTLLKSDENVFFVSELKVRNKLRCTYERGQAENLVVDTTGTKTFVTLLKAALLC